MHKPHAHIFYVIFIGVWCIGSAYIRGGAVSASPSVAHRLAELLSRSILIATSYTHPCRRLIALVRQAALPPTQRCVPHTRPLAIERRKSRFQWGAQAAPYWRAGNACSIRFDYDLGRHRSVPAVVNRRAWQAPSLSEPEPPAAACTGPGCTRAPQTRIGRPANSILRQFYRRMSTRSARDSADYTASSWSGRCWATASLAFSPTSPHPLIPHLAKRCR